MRALGHARLVLFHQRFEFGNHRRFQDMFDPVRVAIDLGRRDVGVVNQKQFPHAMIPHRPPGEFQAIGRQAVTFLGIPPDQGPWFWAFRKSRRTRTAVQDRRCEKFFDPDGLGEDVFLRGQPDFGFNEFKHGPEQIVLADPPPQLVLIPQPINNAPFRTRKKD